MIFRGGVLMDLHVIAAYLSPILTVLSLCAFLFPMYRNRVAKRPLSSSTESHLVFGAGMLISAAIVAQSYAMQAD